MTADPFAPDPGPVFLRITPDLNGNLELHRWCKLDEQGRPIGLTVDLVGVGRFVVPLLVDGDAT